jgi:hypothetical protein
MRKPTECGHAADESGSEGGTDDEWEKEHWDGDAHGTAIEQHDHGLEEITDDRQGSPAGRRAKNTTIVKTKQGSIPKNASSPARRDHDISRTVKAGVNEKGGSHGRERNEAIYTYRQADMQKFLQLSHETLTSAVQRAMAPNKKGELERVLVFKTESRLGLGLNLNTFVFRLLSELSNTSP